MSGLKLSFCVTATRAEIFDRARRSSFSYQSLYNMQKTRLKKTHAFSVCTLPVGGLRAPDHDHSQHDQIPRERDALAWPEPPLHFFCAYLLLLIF